MVVDPRGTVIARHKSRTEEGIVTAHIPIAEFRKGRRIPQYSVALTQQVFEQYVEEIPMDHLDLSPEDLPTDGQKMKALLDRRSRWVRGESEPNEQRN